MSTFFRKLRTITGSFLLAAATYFNASGQVIDVPHKIEIKRSSEHQQFVEVPVIIKRTSDTLTSQDIVLNVSATQSTTLPDSAYSLINSSLVFSAFEFKDDKSVKKMVMIKLLPDSHFKEHHVLVLQFTPDDSLKITPQQCIIQANAPVKRQDSLDRESPVRWAVGANFDFLDGLKPNHLYTNLNIFLPNLMLGKKEKRFGLYLSMSRNRYANRDSLNNITPSYYAPTAQFDSTWHIQETYKQKVEITTNTLSIIFQPTFKMPEKNESFDWYGHFHCGGLQVNEQETYTYELLSVDTLGKGTMSASTTSLASVIKKPSYDTYFGPGLTLISRYKTIEISLMGTYGRGFDRSHIRDEVQKRSFYLVQFNVTEFKSKFTLGAELRSFTPADYPLISIHLSKIFDIQKVGEAIFN